MKDHYTIQEFYLLLKLDLFRGGKVGNWGYISQGNINGCFLRKPFEDYENQSYAKAQLNIGLYLLDLYPISKHEHIMVISVCRTTLSYKEKVYVLKLSGNYGFDETRTAIEDSSLSKRRRSVFRKKAGRARFDGSPLNAIERRH
ncbi:hypothetical protein [Dysgonomonas sp. 511]|uniref:hypothetical protein n=1 Tax=Dysgonomonas sp. 511 TaxID=2302930 RepID=UPI0013D2D2A2|nr:hypothetical protein [Dysgonomonas sp. 511]NDV78485.1 hypothetical protein [Dysgonomonas sp. 511]